MNPCCVNIRAAVAGGYGKWDLKARRNFFQSDGNFIYFDSGSGYPCVCVCQNSVKAHLRLSYLIVYKLYAQIFLKIRLKNSIWASDRFVF